MSVQGLYERIIELEARFAIKDENLPYSHRVLIILDVYEAMLTGLEEPLDKDEETDIELLYKRIMLLEKNFSLDPGDKSYSQRALAIIDVYETRFFGESPPEPEVVAKAVEVVTGETVEAQMALLEAVVGDVEHVETGKGPQSMEAALLSIQSIIDGGGSGSGDDGEEKPEFEIMQEKARGSNVNEQTLLATDYLNHFNEIVMTIEMIADMPELLEEGKEWSPKSYKDHFRESSIADKELAVEAYDHVPDKFRTPFEKTIGQINQLIATTIEKIEADMERGDENLLRENATSLSRTIQRLMDTAGAIIHGSENTMDQAEIDLLLF